MLNEKNFFRLYTELINPVLDKIVEHKLCVVPHLVGKLYGHSKLRLMVVGRAVNGWEDVEFSKCASVEAAVALVKAMHDSRDFSRIVDKGKGQKDWYLFSRSAFWRLIHNVLVAFGEGTSDCWYDDQQQWQEKVLWSNLYKVAPRDGGNPDEPLQKLQYQKCVEILKEEIATYKPTHILFVTGDDWFFYDKWEGYFADALKIKKLSKQERNDKYILGSGIYNDAKVVVCVRPECKPGAEICAAVMNRFRV